MISCIKDCISFDDPLSEEVINYLIHFREENELIDFKVSFENQEREWLEISKDTLAFSNTHGGYLIFGIKNSTFEIVGLPEETFLELGDASKFMQKINRHVDPSVNLIRCKRFKFESKDLLAIFIPPSLDKTHLVSKDAFFNYDSGKEKHVLKEGTTYVRISAGNHLMDSRDLDDIINRRIDHFKHSLLEKIAKVVESPKGSEIFVVSENKTSSEHLSFIIQDAPDAIPVKGMSFTVSPETTEQEIMGWIAMTKSEPEAIPSAAITWKWYRIRESINLTDEQRIWVARYSLLNKVPAFYWLSGSDAVEIHQMLIESIVSNKTIDSLRDNEALGNIVATGAFLSRRSHKALLARCGELIARLPRAYLEIPHNGPKVYFRADKYKKAEAQNYMQELNEITESTKGAKPIPILRNRWKAVAIDCFIYAQDNHYNNKMNE